MGLAALRKARSFNAVAVIARSDEIITRSQYEKVVVCCAISSYMRFMADQNIFDRFGGIRPMAEALSRPPSTVQSWKNVGRIPADEQPRVLAKALELELDVSAEDIIFPLGRPPVGPSEPTVGEAA